MKKVLHVGCGGQTIEQMGPAFKEEAWQEVRFDIDEAVKPDILGTTVDMKNVASQSVDAVWSSHNIEHVFYHEVPKVLSEFWRVLNDDGFCVVTCPDLEEVCKRVTEGSLTGQLYESPAGPITALDVFYGHIASVTQGQVYMAHKTGFNINLLSTRLQQAGFKRIVGGRRPPALDLWCVAFKNDLPEEQAKELFQRYTGIKIN